MSEKSRIKNLSTRFLTFYKFSVATIIAGLVIAYLVEGYFAYIIDKKSYHFLMPLTWSYLIFVWFNVNRKVFRVEFDDEFLYVILKKNDILIPLENIKDVNLVSLGGVYRIDLYNAEQVGDKFYFKPSLLYPFNAKKKDELVNVLWQKINQAKKKPVEFQKNALRS